MFSWPPIVFYLFLDEYFLFSGKYEKLLQSIRRWKHLCQYAIDSTPKFLVGSLSRFDWLSKLTKYPCLLHVNFSMSFWRRIYITLYALFPFYHLLTFSRLGPVLSQSGIVPSWCNFNDIDVITDIGTTGAISSGNFATTQIHMNKDHFYLLQNNTNK